ncbi:acetyltransferase [Azospirillaceae bacterium]
MSIRNFKKLVKPQSIAVIGASTQPHRAGNVIMRNLLAGGFNGPIMPVNPRREAVAGVLCYPKVSDLPRTPDLAVICRPAEETPDHIMELGRHGVLAAIAITGNGCFSYNNQGRIHLQRIQQAARAANVRVLGPNGLGMLAPGDGINASFSHISALPGRLGFVCQSPGVCATILDWARPRGIGFSLCLSLGDCADIGFDNALDYLSRDPKTEAILLYVESFNDRRNFMAAARAAARAKPVVCIKRSRFQPPPYPPGSQTAALTAPDDVFDTALRRAGILRVYDLAELFGAVDTLSRVKSLYLERLTILTNNATIAAIAVDELHGAQEQLAQLSDATIAKLDQTLRCCWSRTNPIDILVDADGERYANTLKCLLEDGGIDQILALHAPTGIVSSEAVATAVIRAVAGKRTNIVTSWVGEETATVARKLFNRAGIPTYDSPARAAASFMHLVNHRRNLTMLMETPPATPTDFSVRPVAARVIIDRVLGEGRTLLTEFEAAEVLAAYGVNMRQSHFGADGEAALGMTYSHAFRLQGRSLMIGVTTDSVFGPVILFGEGGESAAVSRDYAITLPPLNLPLARDAVMRTRVYKSLAAGGDWTTADINAICKTLIQVSHLVVDCPEITDLDINPICVDDHDVLAYGALLRLAPVVNEARRRLSIRPYPQELEETALLSDGRAILLRPIRPEDEPAHHDFVSRLTPEDIRFRFFGFVRRFEHTQMARLTQIDYDREMAFIAVAFHSDNGLETLGVVRAIFDPDNVSAEFSIVIRSDLKGLSLGRLLMEKIMRYCAERGATEIIGQVLPDNIPMQRMLRKLGFRFKMIPEEEILDARRSLI